MALRKAIWGAGGFLRSLSSPPAMFEDSAKCFNIEDILPPERDMVVDCPRVQPMVGSVSVPRHITTAHLDTTLSCYWCSSRNRLLLHRLELLLEQQLLLELLLLSWLLGILLSGEHAGTAVIEPAAGYPVAGEHARTATVEPTAGYAVVGEHAGTPAAGTAAIGKSAAGEAAAVGEAAVAEKPVAVDAAVAGEAATVISG